MPVGRLKGPVAPVLIMLMMLAVAALSWPRDRATAAAGDPAHASAIELLGPVWHAVAERAAVPEAAGDTAILQAAATGGKAAVIPVLRPLLRPTAATAPSAHAQALRPLQRPDRQVARAVDRGMAPAGNIDPDVRPPRTTSWQVRDVRSGQVIAEVPIDAALALLSRAQPRR